MAKHLQLIICLAALLWPADGAFNHQQQQAPQQQAESIRVETSLVSVPVVVTDSAGRFVTGLERSDFQLYEDGTRQEIVSFAAAAVPFQVALLIDTSRSARYQLQAIRRAALDFVKQLQPQDRVLIVTFDEAVNLRGGFTSDRRRLQQTINSIRSNYLTKLYDGITQVITEELAPLDGRKAIVLFTDGIDTLSRKATCQSTLELVARAGVPVYPLHFEPVILNRPNSDPCSIPGGRLPPSFATAGKDLQNAIERHIIATGFLRALAEQSGARYLQAADIERSAQAFKLIADELRHQYTLGYYSTNERRDGGYRRITVRLARGSGIVRARPGYLASTGIQSPPKGSN